MSFLNLHSARQRNPLGRKRYTLWRGLKGYRAGELLPDAYSTLEEAQAEVARRLEHDKAHRFEIHGPRGRKVVMLWESEQREPNPKALGELTRSELEKRKARLDKRSSELTHALIEQGHGALRFSDMVAMADPPPTVREYLALSEELRQLNAEASYRQTYHGSTQRVRKRNPVPSSQYAQAARRFEQFTGMKMENATEIDWQPPAAVAAIGEVVEIKYDTVRESRLEKYTHQFKKGSRPLLCVTHDGKTALLLGGGRFTFGARGFVDKD